VEAEEYKLPDSTKSPEHSDGSNAAPNHDNDVRNDHAADNYNANYRG
tara:strand:- start:6500 stop:6640 length:141 start_codon:yes stop_codon:yes gene_type:complete